MSPSQAMKEHSYQVEEKRDKELDKATALLTDLTKRGQEIDEPYLTELLEILAEDNLLGDLDRLVNMYDEFDAKKQKFFWHIARRLKNIDKSEMIQRMADQWFRWQLWEEKLFEIYDHIQMADRFAKAAMAARELSSLFAAQGQ